MCAWHRVWLGNAFGWRCTGNGCCGCVGWSCCCTWPNDHFRIVTLCYDHRPCRWILLTKTIKEEKCVWCNRKLHATEKLKSHYSWNCHFIYFMTWYRLFFLLLLVLLSFTCSVRSPAHCELFDVKFTIRIHSTTANGLKITSTSTHAQVNITLALEENEEKTKNNIATTERERGFFGGTRALSLACFHCIRVYIEDTCRKSLCTRSNKFFDILMQSLFLALSALLLCCVKFCVQLMVFWFTKFLRWNIKMHAK